MTAEAKRDPLSTCPEEKRGRYEHWAKNKRSQKGAIALKCLDCVAWDREEVRRCVIRDCSLHRFRPYRVKVIGGWE